MDERTGHIGMKRIFTKPSKPEELYEFFTYGLPLTPTDWSQHWWVNATRNVIKRRLWCAGTTLHYESVMVDYSPGVRADSAWYIYEHKYV